MYTNARKEQEIVVKTEKIPIPIQIEIVVQWDRAVDPCPIV
jgi:hypothetical protein